MKIWLIISLSLCTVALGVALFWHQLVPPVCPANERTLSRAEAIEAARTYVAHQINDQAAAIGQTPDTPVTSEMIALAQPDCCTVLWDLTRFRRRQLAERALPEYMDLLQTHVLVEITEPDLLPPMTVSMSLTVPVTACGQAETVVRSGDGWVRWSPTAHM